MIQGQNTNSRQDMPGMKMPPRSCTSRRRSSNRVHCPAGYRCRSCKSQARRSRWNKSYRPDSSCTPYSLVLRRMFRWRTWYTRWSHPGKPCLRCISSGPGVAVRENCEPGAGIHAPQNLKKQRCTIFSRKICKVVAYWQRVGT